MNPSHGKNGFSYRDAGVDINAGNALIERIKPLAWATRRAGSMGGIGGFGAVFDPKAAGFADPLLISCTDGVGTKLKLAIEANKHDTVGIDLVAMCVNDLVVQGATPLYFLDYFATGKLSVEVAADVIAGIADGCRQSGCELAGGETAEMPGMYANGEYDLAGFSVGAVERGRLLPRGDIQAGDVVLGLASSGVHSNGYSLVRRVVEHSGLKLSDPAPFAPAKTMADILLEPTRIYVQSCLAAIATGHVKGFAHITGGGLLENIPRALPEGLGVELRRDAWEAPAVFNWLQETGGMADEEMHRTFNCGIGMAVICAAEDAQTVIAALREAKEAVWEIGTVAEGAGVRIV